MLIDNLVFLYFKKVNFFKLKVVVKNIKYLNVEVISIF